MTATPSAASGRFMPATNAATMIASPATPTASCAHVRPNTTFVALSRLNDADGTTPAP
ncbi:hypothetical protein [Bifidobacterium bifidum]|uniref:hypothetical protein n=1 Tax=Bifidobacterium bifidum TaxID=1681 RepID=UPI001EF9F407|nr:hypothetical protein [Bifidobacterium bifidum]